jgi:integrase
MVPRTSQLYDAAKHLSMSDITIVSDALLIRFKWTKTIQDGSRVLMIPLIAMPSNFMCPWSAYKHLRSLVHTDQYQSAFCYVKNNVVYNLVTSDVVSVLRMLLSKMGYDPEIFSGHSFRRSGATWAFSAGVDHLSIKHHGDWKSLSYLQYIYISDSQKKQVSQSMLAAISGR